MAVADGRSVLVYKDMGLVSEVFDEPTLTTLQGHAAIGHTRYSTTGASSWDNAQPSFRMSASGGSLAVAHNGNLTNVVDLASATGRSPEASDTDLMADLLAAHPGTLPAAIEAVVPLLEGAFSLVLLDESTVYGVRDRHGVRPLAIGRLADRGWVLASETVALDIVGATFVREVEPGEIVAVGPEGISSTRFAAPSPNLCVFEHVYLARADSRVGGRSVHQVRRALGAALAREAPADADLVIPVPDTAVTAAAGYAEASGIPFGEGLMKNRYVGRTFIQPTQTMRQLGIRLKLNPLREAIRGRRLVVVDDSIVRGNTTKAIVRLLRDAGATEVHVRITSPPVRWPCFYGIDMPTRQELVAGESEVKEVQDLIEADSLGYLSLDALVAASRQDTPAAGGGAGLCTACFTGDYPIPIGPVARRSGTAAPEPLFEVAR
jgi:amidophosphoribosyltransferase